MNFYKKLESYESNYQSIVDLTEIVLKEAGRPMSPKEITQKILDIRPIASKTPNASVCAALFVRSLFVQRQRNRSTTAAGS